jgi:fatty acid desaturase
MIQEEVVNYSNHIFRERYERYKFSQNIKDELKLLTKLDNWHGLLAVLEDYTVIFASILATTCISMWFYPIALILIGSRQRALATLLHESAHNILAKNKTLNWLLGTFASGYLIFQQMAPYKASHCLEHHCHLANPDRDPDFKFYQNEGLYNPLTAREFYIRHIIQPLLFLRVPSYVSYLIQNRFLSNGGRWWESLAILGYWGLIISVTVWLGIGDKIIWFWLVPYFTTFQVIGWFIELSEHYPLLGNNNIDIYLSRNRFSCWYEACLTSIHCENFHLVHHLFPNVPFWNQSKAHQILLADPNYRSHDGDTSGIFFALQSQPSILTSILQHLQAKQNQE